MTARERQLLKAKVDEARRREEAQKDRRRKAAQLRSYHEPIPKPRHNEFTILAAIRSFHNLHGRPPTLREWERGGPHPSPRTVKRHFGTWNEALMAAGCPPRKVGVWVSRRKAA